MNERISKTISMDEFSFSFTHTKQPSNYKRTKNNNNTDSFKKKNHKDRKFAPTSRTWNNQPSAVSESTMTMLFLFVRRITKSPKSNSSKTLEIFI